MFDVGDMVKYIGAKHRGDYLCGEIVEKIDNDNYIVLLGEDTGQAKCHESELQLISKYYKEE